MQYDKRKMHTRQTKGTQKANKRRTKCKQNANKSEQKAYNRGIHLKEKGMAKFINKEKIFKSKIISAALVLSIILSLVLSLGTVVSAAQPAPGDGDEFDLLRLRYFGLLAGKDDYDITKQYIANRVNSITADAQDTLGGLNTNRNTSNRNYLFSWLPLGGSQPAKGANVNESIDNLKNMAVAYRTPASALYGNTNLRNSIISALDWIIDNHYHKDLASSQLGSGFNWWYYEIGIPLSLNDLVVLIYDDLTGAQIEKYMDAVHRFVGDNPRRRVLQTAAETGANLVWKCTVFTQMGIIAKNPVPILAGRDALSDELAYNADNTTGDGYYTDGSFLMHGNYAYNGGYGYSLLMNIVDLLYITNNSSFEVVDPNVNNVYEWIFDSYEPLMYRGAIMDMVRGGGIGEAYPFDQIIGHDTIVAIAKLAEFAPPEYQRRYKELIKHMVNNSNMRNFYSYMQLSMIASIQDIRDDASIADRGYIDIAKQYPTMARTVYQTGKFAVGLSMSSSRIARYEYINEKNKKGWHTGDGMLYLYNSDLRQFNNTNFNDGRGDVGAFWPTVDKKRLPGTTVDTQPLSNGSNGGRTSGWAGGAEWDKYAVSGMLVRGLGYTNLSIKKSYMMLGDKIVALGADLSGTASGDAFETIVENRKITFTPDTPFIVDGDAMPTANFAETDIQGAQWAWLGYSWIPDDAWKPNGLWSPPAGTWGPPSEPEENTYIGYYFPEPADIKVKRETRTGSWLDVGPEATDPAQRSDTYLTMWYNHGKAPATGAGEAYSYVLLPGKNAAEVEAYAGDPDIAVLRNDEFVQAVSDSTLDIMMANFWQSAKASAGGVTLDKPASVIVHADGGAYDFSIADFTMTNAANIITMELDKECLSVLDGDSRVNVVQYAPSAIIEIDMTGTFGRSVVFSLEVDPYDYEDDTAYVSISGPAAVASGAGAKAVYTISGIRMPATDGIELEFEVDGAYLSSNNFSSPGGFNIIGAGSYGTPIQWTNAGDIWTGKVTLINLTGAEIKGEADIFEMVFDVREGVLGAADVKLNYVKFSAAGATVAAIIKDGAATTIFEQYFSPYDLNKDGLIDLNDLTFALQFLTVQEGDPDWDIAKVADFHIDGVIDILDLIEILANYTIPYYA